MWLVERVIDPRPIDAEVDARLRGQVAHQALYRFYAGLPKQLRRRDVDPGRLDEARRVPARVSARGDRGPGPARARRASTCSSSRARSRGTSSTSCAQELALGLAARPAAVRGRVRDDRAAPELQRGLDLGGFTVSGKIDRIDVDPFSARGIVQDYKSGAAYSARRIESDGRLQMPALRARPPRPRRHRAARRPLPVALGRARGARAAARRARATCPGSSRATTSTRRRSGAAVDAGGRAGARRRSGGIRDGDVRHDPRCGELPVLVRPLADLPGGAGVSVAPRRQSRAAGRDRGARCRLRLGGRGHREDDRPRRAVRAGGRGAGLSRRLRPRDHVHGAGGRRAARSAIRARLRELGRRDLARDVDGAWISTIHGFCSRLLRAHPFEAGARPALPRARREPGSRAPRRGVHGRAGGVLRRTRRPSGCGLLATYGARGLRTMLLGVYERLRSAGRPLELARRHRSVLADAIAGCDELQRRRCRRRARPSGHGRSSARSRLPRPSRPTDCSTCSAASGAAARRPAARWSRMRAEAVERRRSSDVAARDRMLLEELLRGFDTAYTRAKARESARRLRGPAAARPGPAARRDDGCEDGAAPSLPLDHGGRVPGHEPAAVRARRLLRCAGDPAGRALLRRRRVPVDLPVPPRGRRRLPGARARERRRARADAELPLAARGARRRQPSLRCRVRRAASSLSEPAGRFPEPLARLCGRAARHRQGELPRRGDGWRVGGGAARRAPRPGARRRGEVRTRGRRAPVRGGDERRGIRGGAAGGGPADSPRDRPRLLRPAAGRRPARLPAAAPQPLRRRGARLPCLRRRSSGCRTTRSCSSGARPASGRSSAASSGSCRQACRSATGAGFGRSASATSGSPRVSAAARARAPAASGSSPSTTTTSRCSRAGTAGDDTRTSASSRGLARSYEELRGRDLEGFVRFVRDQEARRRARGRGGLRGGGRRSGSAADDSRGEGPRVQGRRRVRRRPHVRPGSARTRSSACRTAASGSALPIPRAASASESSATTRFARPSARRRRPRDAASTTSR